MLDSVARLGVVRRLFWQDYFVLEPFFNSVFYFILNGFRTTDYVDESLHWLLTELVDFGVTRPHVCVIDLEKLLIHLHNLDIIRF